MYSEHDTARSGGAENTTNNQMELRAVYEALKWALSEDTELTLFSDSQWALGVVQAYRPGKKYRNPIGIQQAHQIWAVLRSSRKVKFIWVKGHDKSPQNSRADQIARREAQYAAGVE